MEKETLYQDLLEGLQETKAFLEGNCTEGDAVIRFNGTRISIRHIRKQLNMTREDFAKAFFFSIRSIQNWERGFRKPNPHTLAYLQLIAADPKGVYKTLHPDP